VSRRTRVWRDGKPLEHCESDAELSECLGQDGVVVWIDLCESAFAELSAVAELLGLNQLAVEDALAPQERAKLDRYHGNGHTREHLFLNLYHTTVDRDSGELHTGEMSAFVTCDALVTVRSRPGLDLADLTRRWESADELRRFGVGLLLHGLLDQIVDGHFLAVQTLDSEVERLEDLLFADGNPGDDRQLQLRSFGVRKSLVLLRRVVLPMREILNTLMRRDLHLIPDGMMPYFQDVYDHVLRASEWTDGMRDLVTTILDTRIALADNRLNQVMKQITAWAAVIAVPTAVTGFFGMNVPYPGFGSHWGFGVSLAILLVSAVALYAVFRRKDWL
jgi:magnesium transporter